MATATNLSGADISAEGAGEVNLGTAIAAPVVPDTGSLNLGVQEWPHDDDEPVVRTVIYRNDGTAAVTLDVDATLTGPDGAAAPEKMIAVTPERVTVPAGGTAAVKATVDTSVSAPDGRYTGRITASAAGVAQPVSTLVSVVRDVERYALTVKVADRHGADAVDHFSMITSRADHSNVVEWTPGGYTTRLPVGDYTVGGLVFTDSGTDAETITLLAQPRLKLTKNMTIVLDARTGQPVTATVPEPTATFMGANIGYRVIAPYPASSSSLYWLNERSGFDNLFTAQIGPSDTSDTFRSDIYADWGKAAADGSFLDSPYTYHLGWVTSGSLPTGLTRRIRPADLATVKTDYHFPAGHAGSAGSVPVGGTGFINTLDMSRPGQYTHYYHGNDNLRWTHVFTQMDASRCTETALAQGDLSYRAGRTYQETWNGGVLGPAFGNWPARSYNGIRRSPDDTISVYDGLLVDPTPGRGSLPKGCTDSERTALYRNGEMVAENPSAYGVLSASVPPDEAAYRLEAAVDRSSHNVVSTKISVAWTFRSRHNAASLPVALPLMAVRYAPALEAGYAAPAGQPFQIPIRVDHQPGSVGGKVTGLTVEVSYDDGATWKTAPVSGGGGKWLASVTHPTGDGHVSLRATATDSNGGKVEQTIIRAYLLRSQG
ncbi:hypothetical protein O7626_20310 [Micromonospora sp. WMMD1102]|uniref:hypothetical protein n=1 Tax=Micromonospora sp. WMMD1102 TaxID=3016105 RepID=UPI00241534E9|nr:hypothetical protein [Micromonospora sp. WMMD1102]MDG4788253.1 hypothetical protein [Micromonospora sp. WMMD1102]